MDKKSHFAFTLERLQKLPTPPAGLGGKTRRMRHHDTKVPGLVLYKTNTGIAAFYVYRWFDGRPINHRLGGFPALSIDDARNLAAEINAKLARGEDPRDDRRKARAAITLAELFTYFLDNHAKVHKRTWATDEKVFNRYLATWKNRRIDTISIEDVKALHRKLGKANGHYAANRLRSLLHAMFALAITDLGLPGPNPVHGVRRFREESRERFLHADELPRFFDALAELRATSPVCADFIEVAIWTGARRSNVLAMRWDEINLDRATWIIPANKAKAGDPLTVHLPEPATTILKQRLELADSEWVFPGRRRGKHLMSPEKPWKALLKAADLSDLRIHDLRRSLGSWMAGTGASLQTIGKTLGHRHHGTTAIYSRLDLDPVRAAVDLATEAMLTAAKPTVQSSSP